MSGCCVGPFLASLPSTLSIYKPCSDNQHPERDGVAQIWKLNVSIPKPDSKPDQFPIILHWLCRQHITGNCYDIIISTMSQSHDGKWICESFLAFSRDSVSAGTQGAAVVVLPTTHFTAWRKIFILWTFTQVWQCPQHCHWQTAAFQLPGQWKYLRPVLQSI